MRPIENIQKKLIHLAIKSLGVNDDDYRALLYHRFGVQSCKQLTFEQASGVIDDFKRKGFRIRKRVSVSPRRPLSASVAYLPSPQQMHVIEHLRKDVRWRVHDGFYLWVEKFLGKKHITNTREAQKVIEALKAMKSRQQRKLDEEARNAGEKI